MADLERTYFKCAPQKFTPALACQTLKERRLDKYMCLFEKQIEFDDLTMVQAVQRLHREWKGYRRDLEARVIRDGHLIRMDFEGDRLEVLFVRELTDAVEGLLVSLRDEGKKMKTHALAVVDYDQKEREFGWTWVGWSTQDLTFTKTFRETTGKHWRNYDGRQLAIYLRTYVGGLQVPERKLNSMWCEDLEAVMPSAKRRKQSRSSV